MKSHFHMKRWAPRLTLKKRLKVIRKWRIDPLHKWQLIIHPKPHIHVTNPWSRNISAKDVQSIVV